MSSEGLSMICSNKIDPYKRICSITTIQSDQRGCFASIVEKLRESANYEAAILKIEQIEDQMKIMKIVSSIENLGFSPKPVFKAKNENEAINLRLQGNKEFQKKNYQKAFLLYSASVMSAEHPDDQVKSSTLAFSLGNRSACLLNLGNYEEASSDINLALALGYPEEGRYKLYERLGRIYSKMGLAPRAKTAFMIAKQLVISSSSLTDEKKNEFLTMVEQLSKENERLIQVDKKSGYLSSEKSEIGVQGLTSKVDVAFQPDCGRFVMAKEKIEVAETILVEDPYAAVLYPEKNGFNCGMCFKKLVAAVPCQRCSGIAFCSVSCRDSALNSFHKFECQFQDILNGLGCSQVVRLALRMVAQKSLQFLLENKDLILSISDGKNVDELPDEPFIRCLALVGLSKQRWPEDNLLRGLMSFILLSILRASGFFGECKETTCGNNLSNNELYVGSVIMRCLQMLQFNAHEVYQVLRVNPKSLKPCKNVSIGLAIYPSASYFNHSCHGDVSRFFVGKRLHVKSLHTIQPGQEVSENYGPTFYLKEKSFRQRELSGRYWFTCSCTPCKENWPALNKLEEAKSPMDLKSVDMAMSTGDTEASIQILTATLAGHKKGCKPTQDVIRAEDKLRTCISNLGSFSVVETPNP